MNMKKNNIMKIIRIFIPIIIIVIFVWFLVLKPGYMFKQYEKQVKKAAERYYEINSDKLPTGNRVKTLSVQELYRDAYIKEDMFLPYSKEPCDAEKSWVKVKKDNNDYKYIVYLQCGVIKSTIDHTGPIITLNGSKKIEVELNSIYEDPGIKSIVDKKDGNIDIKTAKIENNVNTSKIGEYQVVYTVMDKLNNKTVVKRTVNVVETLSSTIKKQLKNEKTFKGNPENNYIRLSNMDFRIVGIESDDNIKVVAEQDVSYINYSKIDDWINGYYLKHLNDKTKKIIVESEFCNKVKSVNSTECSGKTEKKKIYIPSIMDLNKANDLEGNYMMPKDDSWLAENENSDKAYYIDNMSNFTKNKPVASDNQKLNKGIKPIFVIKGNTKIIKGNGTKEKPYDIGTNNKIEYGENVSSLSTGEFITIDEENWRVIDKNDDGTIKIIKNTVVSNFSEESENNKTLINAGAYTSKIIYNPKNKNNYANFINNKLTKYINTKYFANHEIVVPIYKNDAVYNEQTKTKKYEVMISAPNMYEMFSANTNNSYEEESLKYWFINSIDKEQSGCVYNDFTVKTNANNLEYYYVRPVAFLKNNKTVFSGEGTFFKPYKIK